MKAKLRVWITFGDDLKFGDGRARLLELIDERGSLSKAAGALEMSYRNAWGNQQDLERAAGFKFVERVPGRGPRSGMRLTAEGRRFLARYRTLRDAVDDTMTRRFADLFSSRSPGVRPKPARSARH